MNRLAVTLFMPVLFVMAASLNHKNLAFATAECPSGSAPQTRDSTNPRAREEELQALRASLKTKLGLAEGAGAFEWQHPSRDPHRSGTYRLSFPRAARIKGLPKGLQDLMSKPWGELVGKARGAQDTPPSSPLYNEPILDLKVVSSQDLTVFHETKFGAIKPLVMQQGSEPQLSGILDANALRLTNRETEPAFYTSLDPLQGDMGLNGDVYFKLQLGSLENVFLLVLNEPASDAEKARFFKLLSGDAKFWPAFLKAHSEGTVYDFDIFQAATLQILREKYALPVDMMLFTKDFLESRGMGRREPQVYAWVIVFERTLLQDAKVSAVYLRRFSETAQAPQAVDAKYYPLTRKFFDHISAHPELIRLYDYWRTTEPVTELMRKLEINDIRFYSVFMGRFLNHLTSDAGITAVQERLQSLKPGESVDGIFFEVAEKFARALEFR